MASKRDDEDPDIAAGRAITSTITSGKKSAGPRAEPEDPDVVAGRAVTAPVLALPASSAPASETERPGIFSGGLSLRGTAREVAAALPRVGGNVINLLSDPYANLVGYPLTVAGQTAYDFLAPKLGYDKLTPEQRNALYADFADQPGQKIIQGAGNLLERTTNAQPGSLDPYNVQGTTPAEKLAGKVTEGVGTAAALGPGGVAPAVAGGVGVVGGNALADQVPDWLKPAAELVGNVGGAAATGVGTSVARTVRGAVSDVSAADATLGRLAKDKYDIPINAQDLSSNAAYRIAADQASKLPFSGAGPSAAAKHNAWQGAIAKEMGEPNATAFTSEVMDRARTRIGGEFDRVANSTSIDTPSVNAMIGDLATIERDMHMVLPTNELPKLKAQLDNIVDVASKQNGTIGGDSYQALTRKGAPLDLAERSTDPNVRHVASQIRDALDDAFVRSASLEDQAALVRAKYQYRVMRTIDQLVAGSRDGNITPAGFMQKVVTTSRKFDSPTGGIAYTGGGNIGELARIGQLMRPSPNSSTADRAAINALTFGGGPTLAYLMENPYLLATVPAGLATNRAVGAWTRSGPLANKVMTNALRPPLPSPYVVGAPIITSGDTRPQ